MGDEGQAYDLGGHGLVAHDELNRCACRCECGFDIAHGYGAIGWAAAAIGTVAFCFFLQLRSRKAQLHAQSA